MNLFHPERILAAVDLSPASRTILSQAGEFARAFEAGVTVFYADWWEPPPYFTHGQIEALRDQAARHRTAVEDQLAELAQASIGADIPYDVSVTEGQAAVTILGEARNHRAGLIVVGSHGRTGVARLRLGSVAEDVTRHATLPVLVVKELVPEAGTPPIRHLLCPVDFSDHARHTLEISSELASAFKAQLSVVHAVPANEAPAEETYKKLCSWIPAGSRKKCRLQEVVRKGPAAEQVLLLAKEQRADLIVLAAQRKPFLEVTTLGTTTERVMRHSPVSVLVVPERQGEV